MKKKMLVLFAVLLSAFTLLCACSDESGPPGDTSASETSVSEALSEETTTADPYMTDLPELDFGGASFNILYPEWSLYRLYYFAEAENGDAINDAAFKRTFDVEHQLNVDITWYVPGNITTIYPEVKKTVLAGDDTYQLALMHNKEDMGNYVMDKILLDWHTLPYIDMTKPYWNQSVQEVMNINNVLLFNSSDFIIPDTETFFFSKRIAEDYSIPNLYETVLDGKWTWDLALEYIEKVTHDINGDGVMDIDDQYGYVGQNSYCSGDSMQVASGIQNIRVIDGEYVLDIEFDKLTTLFSKTTRLTNDNSIAFTWKYNKQYDPNGGNLPYLGVYTDRVLFEYATLSVAELYRASEFDFGIIPLPKFDEAQEQHWSLNTSGFMIIPLTVGDIELVGAVTELLSAENSRTVLPAFHEVLLKQKVSRDTDSEVMLDMIFENMIYTPSWNLSISVNGLEIGGNLSSYVASKETVWLKSLDDYNSWYADYETE